MAVGIAGGASRSQGGRRDLVAESTFWRQPRAHTRAGGRARSPGRGTSVAASPGMPDSTRSLVRQLRQQLGMTQEEFAHEIAVTVSTVNRWENAHAQPSKLAWKAIKDLARQRGLPAEGMRTLETF